MIGRNQITGLVLAGGRGLRMAGADKGLQIWRGETLAAHALSRLAPQVDRLLVSANRNLEAYAAFGSPVLIDDFAGFAGPLAGMLSGLERAETDFLAVVACDVPNFPPDLVARLAAAFAGRACDIAVAATPFGHAERLEPTFLVARRSVAGSLRAFLERGERQAERWIRTTSHTIVAFPDTAAFVNANTLDDLQALEAK